MQQDDISLYDDSNIALARNKCRPFQHKGFVEIGPVWVPKIENFDWNFGEWFIVLNAHVQNCGQTLGIQWFGNVNHNQSQNN